jgi:tetratricopeptide (TPR) repeat protein
VTEAPWAKRPARQIAAQSFGAAPADISFRALAPACTGTAMIYRDPTTARGSIARVTPPYEDRAVLAKPWRRVVFMLILRFIFVTSLAVCGGAVLTLCRALFEPGATWSEFLSDTKGILSAAAVALSFIVGPVLFIFERSALIAKIRTTIQHSFLSTYARSVTTCILLIAFDCSSILAARALGAHPTKFDDLVKRCQTYAFRLESSLANACLSNAESEARLDAHKQQITLAKSCAQISNMMRDRIDDAEEWRHVYASVNEWEQRNTRSVFSRLAIAQASMHIRNPEMALRAVDEADRLVRDAKEKALSSLVRGEVEIARRNWTGALTAYETALARNSSADTPETLKNLAIVYFQLRRWGDAERTLLSAKDKYFTTGAVDQLALILSNIGFIQMLEGKLNEAEATIKESLGADQLDIVTRQNMAILQTLKGDYVLAERILDSIDPGLKTGLSDFRRNKLLKAWSRMRNTARPQYEVLMALQEARGVKPSEQQAKDDISNQHLVLDEMIFAADLVKLNEGTYGLEFIEADFLRQAISLEKDNTRRDLLQQRLNNLPPAVIEISNASSLKDDSVVIIVLAITSEDHLSANPGCLVSVNDEVPVWHHDGDIIATRLGDRINMSPSGIEYSVNPAQVTVSKAINTIRITTIHNDRLSFDSDLNDVNGD